MTAVTGSVSKYKISRRGRKLQVSDDQRTLVALPKDVPERTWAEVLQKEENDLVVYEIREEILDDALKIGFDNYMEKQTAVFAVHCASQAWLKLINWQFYLHDPGEDPSSFPPCYIPKRAESWIPDELPYPSPKDTWGRQNLTVVDETPDKGLQKWPSSSSLELPLVEEIPSEYWFPGKVNVPGITRMVTHDRPKHHDGRKIPRKPLLVLEKSGVWSYVPESSSESLSTTEEYMNTESEVVQKVTDYSTEGMSEKQESPFGAVKMATPVDGSLHGAGDSTVVRPKRRLTEKSKSFIKPGGRSKPTLPPIHAAGSRSRLSFISDCRLRNLRLDTQYEITSEKVDTPLGEIRRK